MFPLFATMFAAVSGVWLLSLAAEKEKPEWLRTSAVIALMIAILCTAWIWMNSAEAATHLAR